MNVLTHIQFEVWDLFNGILVHRYFVEQLLGSVHDLIMIQMVFELFNKCTCILHVVIIGFITFCGHHSMSYLDKPQQGVNLKHMLLKTDNSPYIIAETMPLSYNYIKYAVKS